MQFGRDWKHINGICYTSKEKPQNAQELPSEVISRKEESILNEAKNNSTERF
jgi:hypothetical protein